MKAEELRIGNWVHAFKTSYKVDRYDFGTEVISTFKPIPLTEEWLLKFGFVTKSIDSKVAWIYNGFRVKDWSTGFFYGHIEVFLEDEYKDIDDVEIYHVHQLQNLYFALTSEELQLKEQTV